MRLSPIRRAASSRSSSGEIVSGRGVIIVPTVSSRKALPSPAARRTSRSVKIPTSRGPSQTATEPMFSSSIRAIATWTVSSGETVTTRNVIASATGTARAYDLASLQARPRSSFESGKSAQVPPFEAARGLSRSGLSSITRYQTRG